LDHLADDDPSYFAGHGQVQPLCFCGGALQHGDRWSHARLPLPKGLGRLPCLSEIALIFILRAEIGIDGVKRGSKEDLENYGLHAGEKLIQVGVLLETFTPGHGWTSHQPKISATISGGKGSRLDPSLKGFRLNGRRLLIADDDEDFPSRVSSSVSNEEIPHSIAWGGHGGIRLFDNVLSFRPVVLPATTEKLLFTGSTRGSPVRVILNGDWVESFDVESIYQSYQCAFRPAELPIPIWWTPTGRDGEENSLWRRLQAAIIKGDASVFSEKHDVVQSLVPSHGDFRVIGARRVVPSTSFVRHPLWGKGRMAHSLMDFVDDSQGPKALPGASFAKRPLLSGVRMPDHLRSDFTFAPGDDYWAIDVDSREERRRAPFDPEITGDFDTGYGNAPDGPYINRPDDGDARGLTGKLNGTPYFDHYRESRKRSSIAWTPNRAIASPGVFGSLPTGVQHNVPWQTLLFHPMPPEKHYGAKAPPDHLWMDLFWMPVVEPWPISQTFSTAGKINLNYQILPFQYIKRATGLHALMKAEKLLAIPRTAAATYKTGAGDKRWRHFIDIEETLKQWEEKFARGEVFRAGSELCEMYLRTQ